MVIYLGDLIILAKSFEEHLRRLDQVFIKLGMAGLKHKKQ